MIQSDLKNFLFLDIETVPVVYRYEDLEENWKKLFEKKVRYRINEENPPEQIYEKAGIWAEFGKVVAVGFGKFKFENNKQILYVKTLANPNEKHLLEEVRQVLDNFYKPGDRKFLCAHNGKEFDFPFLARRMLINQIKLPEVLKTHGMKPWETPYCDTMELWSFGDRKHYTSLELLSALLNIPTSKENFDGSEVARIYYEEKNLQKIAEYCTRDVVALVNVFLRFREEEILTKDQVVFI